MNQGCIHIYYGEGKGKTTCAMGMAIRAAGAGLSVAVVQFDKGYNGKNEHYYERKILRQIPGIDLYPFGCERMLPDGSFRWENTPDDAQEAQRALELSHKIIRQQKHSLVILDEILSVWAVDLITEADVLQILAEQQKYPKAELVLTGRKISQPLLEQADLVTEMRKEKHYYDHGEMPRKGIEY